MILMTIGQDHPLLVPQCANVHYYNSKGIARTAPMHGSMLDTELFCNKEHMP